MLRAETRVFAGMDEAGLGPLLGPLTIGWSAFRVPRGSVDLWSRLAKVVSADPADGRGRLVVADSKRVFARNPCGARRLEATALAFLAQLDPAGHGPRSGAELFALAPPALRPRAEELARHPWYALLATELPRSFGADALTLKSHLLRRELALQEVALADGGVRAIPAGELNDFYRRTGSKALTHWWATSAVVAHLWSAFAADGLSLFVDRLGARRRYVPLLAELFPRATVKTLRESATIGEYVVVEAQRRMRIVFVERGEQRSFAVALASCIAKYARELSMDAFNCYFGALQPGLRPTAGYTTDGRRWLAEAREALAKSRLAPAVVIRER